MNISAQDAREAETAARNQRLQIARLLLRSDEAKAPSSADVMRIRRVMASVTENGSTYDSMLAEPTTQRLFDSGLYTSLGRVNNRRDTIMPKAD